MVFTNILRWCFYILLATALNIFYYLRQLNVISLVGSVVSIVNFSVAKSLKHDSFCL